MNLNLSVTEKIKDGITLSLPGSKSETNRLLILQSFYSDINLENISDSDDSRVLSEALKRLKFSSDSRINVGHAGTAMRFLTAFCAARDGVEVTLEGSERMHQRPIGTLVDALRQIGADIEYIKNTGFPPLLIHGKKLESKRISIDAGISSQFLTALLLIAPQLPAGIEIELKGFLTSRSYVEMTLAFLKKIGIETEFEGSLIKVHPAQEISSFQHIIESDWSSLSYYYSLLALLPYGSIRFQSFHDDSLQGDAALATIYEPFGVKTSFESETHSIVLTRIQRKLPKKVSLDLNNTPDIAQTLAVTCFGLGIECDLSGLHTLKIKETDRLKAMKTELEKLGASVTVTNDSLHLKSGGNIYSGVRINTYNDHRMAMAFAPLIAKTSLVIKDAQVVSKSYPDFWLHLRELGLKVERLT